MVKETVAGSGASFNVARSGYKLAKIREKKQRTMGAKGPGAKGGPPSDTGSKRTDYAE